MLVAASRAANAGALPWPAALIVWGPGELSSPHAHHCVQLIVALDACLRVRPRPGARWLRCRAVVVPPDVEHEVDARGVPVLIGFIDLQSELAAGLGDARGEAMVPVPERVVLSWRRALGDPQTLAAPGVEGWVRSALVLERQARPMHPRVRRLLRHLRQETPRARQASLARLAGVAGLSPSRLMHVFSESMGIPLRPYLLWLRVQRAAGALAAGDTIAGAAYAAGFADGSHLTRTFRRMFGMTPREMIRRAPATRELRLDSA